MYIKKVKKRNKGGKKQYEYLHLVENIRTEKGPRQRLLLNLGALDIPGEQYKELANCIEGILTGQGALFSADPKIERHARKAARNILEKRSREEAIEQKIAGETKKPEPVFQKVDINSIETCDPRSIGPEYVCHSMWERLRFNDVLLENGISAGNLPLLKALVIGRLVTPGSERHTLSWAEERSAIYELTGKPRRGSLNSLYRCGDALFRCKDSLETHLAKREAELFSLPERMCFFDLTNTFLEGVALKNSKAKRGRSKEKRSDCKLLTLALIIDEQGFAKYSHLYPGNQNEGKTLKEMIESLVKIRPNLAKDRTVIFDAGIATKENIKYLKDNHFHYIVVNRGKGDFKPADTEKMEVIHEDTERLFKVEVARREENGEVMLLCRSTGRIEKDKGIRTYQENRFIERLEYFKKGLNQKGHTKRYIKLIEMIGRIREKYPSASKLYNVTVVPDDDPDMEKSKAKDIVWEKRSQYIKESEFDGCYVLRTDHTSMVDKEIWKTYIMLTRIERAFRCLKSSLGLRPNFHQLEERADTHLFISVLGYHILHAIEYQLRTHGDHRSWETIRDILSTHQRLTVAFDVKENDETVVKSYIRMCSKAEMEHGVIYHRLGLSDLPLPKKMSVKNQ